MQSIKGYYLGESFLNIEYVETFEFLCISLQFPPTSCFLQLETLWDAYSRDGKIGKDDIERMLCYHSLSLRIPNVAIANLPLC